MSDKRNSDGPPAKKPGPMKKPRQLELGDFFSKGFQSIKTNKKNGRIVVAAIAAGSSKPIGEVNCPHCFKGFKNQQGLNSHMNYCKPAIAAKADKEKTVAAEQNPEATAVFTTGQGGTSQVPRQRPEQRSMINIPAPVATDRREGNRGAAVRQAYTADFKYKHLLKLEEWQEEQRAKGNQNPSVSAYCKEFHPQEQNKWQGFFCNWKKPENKNKIVNQVAKANYGNCMRITKNKSKAPMADMEQVLYQKILDDRKKGRRVSKTRIKIWAKQEGARIDRAKGTSRFRHFKASNGWFGNFKKRHNLKFRKRKNGKKKSTDENMDKILTWYGYFRHNVLPLLRNEPCDHFSEKWGRFPPELRYNMDQVPLPFVVSQDDTYTMGDDDDVHIAGTGKGDLRKRQFTMHIYTNVGSGDKADGYVELIYKSKRLHGEKLRLDERAAWDKRVNMYGQKNVWMDRIVMAESARNFGKHIEERWGGKKVLLMCDNLEAHVFDGTKEIFADGNVFLFCLSPTVTEAIQAIDAGYGRSLRCAIGRLLDQWLMEPGNLQLWESEKGMTAAQRRVLVSKLVADANEEVLGNDDMRVGCFLRTGMLLTLDGSDDDKIKPQGCTKLPIKVPDMVDVSQEPASPSEVMTPEEQEGLIESDDAAIHMGDDDDKIKSNDVVVEDGGEEESSEEGDPEGQEFWEEIVSDLY